jgi:hypothetical protein
VLINDRTEVIRKHIPIWTAKNDVSKIGGSGIGCCNGISSESAVGDAIEDAATVVKAGSDSICGVASGMAPCANNDPVISNGVGNGCIAG